jgi:hypothetical protein
MYIHMNTHFSTICRSRTAEDPSEYGVFCQFSHFLHIFQRQEKNDEAKRVALLDRSGKPVVLHGVLGRLVDSWCHAARHGTTKIAQLCLANRKFSND